MPAIFRVLRKDFLERNKTLKYLKYALGEIILVVIGILIALKINQYNETQKMLNREEHYLQALLLDIEASKDELERVIHKTNYIIGNTDTLFTVLEEGPENFSVSSLINWSEGAHGYSMYTTDQSTAQELVATGEINIIRDAMIRNLVSYWDARLHNIRKFEEECKWWHRRYSTYFSENVDMFRYVYHDSTSFPSIASDPRIFFNNKDFFYNIGGIYTHNNILNRLYREEKSRLDSAAARIEELLPNLAIAP